MKPKNFPRQKLLRQLKALNININSKESKKQLKEARQIRTKKKRI